MVDLRTIEIPTEILNLIPKQTAVDLSVLPLRMETDGVVIAMRKMADSSLLSDLMFLLGKRVKAEIVPDAELTDAIRRLYGVSELEMSRSAESDSHVVSVDPLSILQIALYRMQSEWEPAIFTLNRTSENFVFVTVSTESCTKFFIHPWKNRSRLFRG